MIILYAIAFVLNAWAAAFEFAKLKDTRQVWLFVFVVCAGYNLMVLMGLL